MITERLRVDLVVSNETILPILSRIPIRQSITDESRRILPVAMRIAGWSHIRMIAFKPVGGKDVRVQRF
jgi:hypothetical protein